MTERKIKKIKELKSIVAAAKKKGEKVVFTNGCFDILHFGHIQYLKQSKLLGDKLIVALNTDGGVRRLKGRGRPVFREKERAALLAALECVDYVTLFSEKTPLRLIKTIKPDILVKGADWRKNEMVGKDVVESYGGKVLTVNFIPGYSSSLIIARLTNRKWKENC